MQDRSKSAAKIKRPWSVRAISWLLLGQTAVLAVLVAWRVTVIYLETEFDVDVMLPRLAVLLPSSMALAAVAALALFAALAFFRFWRQGWAYAMLVQGLLLATMLVDHFRGSSFYVYPLMLYGIVMVIYLHHPDVQAAFEVRVVPDEDAPPPRSDL